MPIDALRDRHLSDRVVSPEETLALIQPHLPCSCSNCIAVTLMMAAGYAIGRRYRSHHVRAKWAEIVEGGQKIAALTAAMRASESNASSEKEGAEEHYCVT